MTHTLFCIIDQSTIGTYYVSVMVINKSGKDIVLDTNDNKILRGQKIKKGFIVKYIKSTQGNSPVIVKALDLASQKPLKINGEDSYKLLPTEVKGSPYKIEVSAPGMSSGEL